MDVAHDSEQVAIVLDEAGVVAVLQQVPDAIVAAIEAERISGPKACHEPWKGNGARLEREVGVVRHQDPREAEEAQRWDEAAEPAQEILAVLGVVEDPS